MTLSSKPAKRCHTVCAWAVDQDRVLLVQHKKLGMWLAPGGHVEENELPHQAAIREFKEETGLDCTILSPNSSFVSESTEYLPLPMFCNLHTVNKPRGDGFCEQHYAWGYAVRVQGDTTPTSTDDGVTDIAWVKREDLSNYSLTAEILQEALFMLNHFPSH